MFILLSDTTVIDGSAHIHLSQLSLQHSFQINCLAYTQCPANASKADSVESESPYSQRGTRSDIIGMHSMALPLHSIKAQ